MIDFEGLKIMTSGSTNFTTMEEVAEQRRKEREAADQLAKDLTTWAPTVMLSFFDVDGEARLHQMFVSALGQTEWRAVEKRDQNAMLKAYNECKVFGEDDE